MDADGPGNPIAIARQGATRHPWRTKKTRQNGGFELTHEDLNGFALTSAYQASAGPDNQGLRKELLQR